MATRTRRTTDITAETKASASRPAINANALLGAPDVVLITATDSPFTPETTDGIIVVDATAGDVDIALPALASTIGTPITIKRTDSSGNDVTVTPDGSEEIDGATPYTALAAQYDYVSIYPEPSFGWLIVAAG